MDGQKVNTELTPEEQKAMARVLEFCKLALTENNPDSVLLNAAGTGKRSGVSGKKKPGQENHHLEKREGAWYFRYRYRGKQIYRRASKYITEARVKRDQWLDEFEKCGEFRDRIAEESPVKFKEIALAWCRKQEIRIKQGQIKSSTWRDWKSTVNTRLLPCLGGMPLEEITVAVIDGFIDALECSPKRINNILVPLRSIFKYAKRYGYIRDNPMLDVDNMRVEPADIYPFSEEEIRAILAAIPDHYRPFTITAFFTGMRFGEMAGLRWENINFERRLIEVRETLVYGQIGRAKTKKSKRDVDMLRPVYEALRSIAAGGEYVFRDREGNLMTTDHFREVIWKPALKEAGVRYRPPILTRHTFATLAIDSGEALGWVQEMLGHGSLQMIYTRYYSWIRQKTRSDGSAFEARSLLKSLPDEKRV